MGAQHTLTIRAMRMKEIGLAVLVAVAFTAWVWLCLDVLWPAYIRSVR